MMEKTLSESAEEVCTAFTELFWALVEISRIEWVARNLVDWLDGKMDK